MKVIILCGGKGKRMGKITRKIPKPLVKIGKIPIIQHKINYYKNQGLKNFIFCLGYKGNLLKKFLKKKCNNPIFFDGGIESGILKRIYLARKIINKSTGANYMLCIIIRYFSIIIKLIDITTIFFINTFWIIKTNYFIYMI